MYSRKKGKFVKHLDFMLVDMASIVLALILAYGVRHGFDSIYARPIVNKIY